MEYWRMPGNFRCCQTDGITITGTTTATFGGVLLILAFFQFGQNIWSTKIQVLRISLQTLGSENYVQKFGCWLIKALWYAIYKQCYAH